MHRVVFFLSSYTCIIAYHLGTLDVRRVEPEGEWELNPQDGVLKNRPKVGRAQGLDNTNIGLVLSQGSPGV